MNAATYLAMLGAAFTAGLAGSAHCFGMCGAMAGALGLRARMTAASPLQAATRTGLYHLGRIAGYATVGALGGTFGHSVHWLTGLTQFETPLRVLAGAITLLIALRVLSGWNALAPLERAGARLWQRIQPAARLAAANDRWYGSALTGLLWGWLPCGLVYSMLLVALTAGSAQAGAGVMVAFGIGTLPAMLASSVAAANFPRLMQRPWIRSASGALLAAFGLWMMLAPNFLHVHPAHVH